MQRSSQFNGIQEITKFLFDSSERKEEISTLIKNWSDETYNIYLKNQIFDIDNEDRSNEEVLDKIGQVEFLQDVVEQYVHKKQYAIDLTEDEFKGIALIYELCIKILQVIQIKLGTNNNYQEHINKGLIYNTLLSSVYYFCGREIGMGQMITEFFDQSIEISDDDFIYMKKLIKFFSIKFDERDIGQDLIISHLHNFCVIGDITQLDEQIFFEQIRDCIGPDVYYFQKALDVLRNHSLKLYIGNNGGSGSFIAIDKFKERFLLPGQLEVFKIINQNDAQGVKSNIVTMPTSAGKSLVAELQIAKKLKEFSGKDIIYIAPKVALCDQVTKDLKERFGEIIEESYDDIFDMSSRTITDQSKNILVLTPEKFLGKMGRGYDLSNVSLLIFDEFHNIGNKQRGPKMELLMNIIKLRKKTNNLDIQILLMSAMINNGGDIMNWLGETGAIAQSKISPTRKHVFAHNLFNKKIEYFKDYSNNKSNLGDDFQIVNNNYPKLKNREKVFIYVDIIDSDKGRSIDNEVQRLYSEIKSGNIAIGLNDQEVETLNNFSLLFQGAIEKSTIKSGIGFYHRGLDDNIKIIMAQLFQNNTIKILIGNQTLIEGVNLDIEKIIINSNPHKIFISQIDLHNLIGRSGRMGKQTDGYIFIPQCFTKSYYNGYIKPIKESIYDDIKSISFTGEKRVTQNDTIEQYFMLWLNTLAIDLTEDNVNSILEGFSIELETYFLGYSGTDDIRSVINKIIKQLSSKKLFLKYQGRQADSFYKVTGMSQRNTKDLLNKYAGLLKEYRISNITDDSGYELDDILPEGFYPITIEGKEITRENRNDYTNKSYILPWILSSYQRKVENDEFINETKTIISEKIKQCILWIKYGVHSIIALQIMKNNDFSAELSNLLVNNVNDIGQRLQELLGDKSISIDIKNEIQYHINQ